ncbi:MAG: cofactor-independent phosphoglycerate mutase [Deltaproteobacteria bacterium CG23_combo_of_CG06-09_8_20_14_all_60_8]|nr:MAG: cofactor-independent phosphoglycerate mutase [Deltaproteobacteria bacterium CG23_combo_of_CG06-09_8_20_14_all_60_8]
MKYVILVGDGMGDYPLPELQNRTPLAAARTPAMDALCHQGRLCRLRSIPPGYPPGSDVANLSLMGYRPEEVYTGRAPLEAASMGVALAADETAFRCNLVTVADRNDGGLTMVDYSADHITTAEAAELIKALDRQLGNDHLRVYPGVSYRHLLVYRGDYGSLATVPPHDYTGKEVTLPWQAYATTGLGEFMRQAREMLPDQPVNRQRIKAGKSPANAVWLWGEGHTPAMRTHKELFNISGALISAVDLLKGIGICAGMEIINVEGATGYLDTNYAGKVEAALSASRRHDLVFVHVEAPDEAGHEGSLAKKLQAIEDLDAKVVAPVRAGLEAAGEPFRLVVAMDHLTPLATRTHSADEVPVILFDSHGAWPASGLAYTEANAASTGAPLADGQALYRLLLDQTP